MNKKKEIIYSAIIGLLAGFILSGITHILFR